MSESAPSEEERRCTCGAFVRCADVVAVQTAWGGSRTQHFSCGACGAQFITRPFATIVPHLFGTALLGHVAWDQWLAKPALAALLGVLTAGLLGLALLEVSRWVRHPRKR